MHSSRGEERRNGGVSGGQHPVGKHNQALPCLHGLDGMCGDGLQRLPECRSISIRHKTAADFGGFVTVPLQGGKMHQFVIRQDGASQLDEPGVLRRFFQNIPLVADVGHEAHHEFLADGVNGRVRNLREALLEVVEQQLWLAGHHRQRRLHPHGAYGLGALVRHR